MLKSTLGTSSPLNIKESIGVGNGAVDSSDKVGEIGENLLKRENLSKVNLSKMCFFTLKTSIAFTYLIKAFIKVLILHHFDRKHHIQIETDVTGFAIH